MKYFNSAVLIDNVITFERVVHIITGNFYFIIELQSKPAMHIVSKSLKFLLYHWQTSTDFNKVRNTFC